MKPLELRYRTASRFLEALARYDRARRVVHWYGTDHHWIIVLRPLARRVA